jgi:hypothetical protein
LIEEGSPVASFGGLKRDIASITRRRGCVFMWTIRGSRLIGIGRGRICRQRLLGILGIGRSRSARRALARIIHGGES